MDMEGEVGAAEDEMLESSVHVTGSPGQSTSADVHHVNLVEESDDTVCSPCPRVPDVSLTHYCITFNIMPILQCLLIIIILHCRVLFSLIFLRLQLSLILGFSMGGVVASWLVRSTPERIGFEPWVESLCCILGQDTLLSQCLSPLRCINGYRQIKRDKGRPDESLGVHADFTFYLLCVFQVECSNCANLENKAKKW